MLTFPHMMIATIEASDKVLGRGQSPGGARIPYGDFLAILESDA
jgi:hypothetical protein